MITGLDHVVVVLNDIEAGTATYEVLLGRAPSWRSRGEGSQTVLFTLDNMSLELMAPSGESTTARRIRDVIKLWGEGLASICFATSDIARMHRRLERVALKPDPVAEVESHDVGLGEGPALETHAGDRTHPWRADVLPRTWPKRVRARRQRRLRRSLASTMWWCRPRTPSGPRRSTARASASTWRSTARTRIGAG